MVLVATQVKRRRGTTAENDAFTGAEGEITVDLTKKTIRIHDGETQGGTELARMSDVGSGLDGKITNCITEIPQDIKLELNNGTLTLKAGSKVYVPNGVGIFDEVVIQSDVLVNLGTGNTQFIVYDRINNTLYSWAVGVCSSGGSQPSSQYFCWYDTTNNLVKNSSNYGTTINYSSLPIATTNSTATAIDQIFNGFGYIGSTVFVLPGVKGLIPNGRNADGSLNNIETTVNSVAVHDLFNETNYLGWFASDGYVYGWGVNEYVESENEPNVAIDNIRWFDTRNNRQLRSFGGEWIAEEQLYLGTLIKTSASGNIESFKPKNVFRALDNGDTAYIAHQAMPSGRYTDLSLGVSGSTYTAPADGWFFSRQQYNNGYFEVNSGGINYVMQMSGTVQLPFLIPVKKGATFQYNYSNIVQQSYSKFRFIYAEGAQ